VKWFPGKRKLFGHINCQYSPFCRANGHVFIKTVPGLDYYAGLNATLNLYKWT
jgi:hypothetical protein